MADKLQFGSALIEMREGHTAHDLQYVPAFDEQYQLDEQAMEFLAVCAVDDLPCLLVGPTGCGKSTLVMAMAALLEIPVRRINLHGDVRASDLLGEKTLEVDPATGNTVVVWRDGVLPDAMRAGHWVILDEFDACPASIAMTLQSVLEHGHKLTLAANHGELVTPAAGFRLFATANTLGRGDESGLYNGTNILNEATLDRFVVMACTYPSESQEVQVLVDKTGMPAATALNMVKVANFVRSGVSKGEAFCSFSTRRLLAWSILACRLNGGKPVMQTAAIERAYRLAVANKLGREDATYVGAIVQRVLGFKPVVAQ